MEEKKNIAITLHEAKTWYKGNNSTLKELALKAFTKEELESIGLPQTWKEYCINSGNDKRYAITSDSTIIGTSHNNKPFTERTYCRTKEDAEAFLALMQLKALWHDYVGNFEFDWIEHNYFSIIRSLKNKIIVTYTSIPKTFCFPTKELAEKFLTYFKDLFEIAKPLI